jgi:cystathionine beta-lyase
MVDFDQQHDRRHSNAVKWQVKPNELPMWIADMDFITAPAIQEAMRLKIDTGIFGYETVPDAYYEAVADWYDSRHGARPDTEWLLYVNGVIPALSSIVRRMTSVGDNVVVQAPVYDMFYHSIENNGRHTLSSDLQYEDDGHFYRINFTDLESKLAQPLSTIMILCNPHNPVGRVWDVGELTRIAELCQKHHVLLISDEIHGDLVFKGPEYTPIFALPEPLVRNTVALVSPSKAFNVAVLHVATIVVPDANVREMISRGINNDELAEPNLLANSGKYCSLS